MDVLLTVLSIACVPVPPVEFHGPGVHQAVIPIACQDVTQASIHITYEIPDGGGWVSDAGVPVFQMAGANIFSPPFLLGGGGGSVSTWNSTHGNWTADEFILTLEIHNGGSAVVQTTLHSTPAPDLNCDGTVGIEDLLHLLGAWGTGDYDLTCDGDTGVGDLLVLLANWG